MGVFIDREKCIGCGKCILICPGNIIRRDDDGKAYIKISSDCWSCVSCMKECKFTAISLVVPPEFGGNGGRLTVKNEKNITEWHVIKRDGSEKILITDTEEANKY